MFFFKKYNTSLWCQCDSQGRINAASDAFIRFFGSAFDNELFLWDLVKSFLNVNVVQQHLEQCAKRTFRYVFLKENKPYILYLKRNRTAQQKIIFLWRRLLHLLLDGRKSPKSFADANTKSFFVYLLASDDALAESELPLDASIHTGNINKKLAAYPKDVLDNLPFLVWHIDEALQAVYANRAYLEMEQYLKLRETPNSHLFKGAAYQQLIEKVRVSGAVERAILERNILAEVRIFDVFAFEDAQKKIWFAAHDVTSYKEAQQNLRKQERTVERLFKSLPLSVAIFGEDMRLRTHNSHFSGMFQLDEKWLTEKPLVDDILDVLRKKRMLPEMIDFSAYKHQFRAFFNTPSKAAYEELVHLPNERSLRILLSSYPPSGCLMLCEDMTEKLSLKRKNNEMKIVLHATTHQSPEGVILLSDNQRITFINPTCFGLWHIRAELSALQGKKILEVLPMVGERLYHRQVLHIMAGVLRQSLAMRLPQKGMILLRDGRVLGTEYLPLSSGEHMLKFSDVTAAWEAKETRAESTRLFLVERYLFLARLRQIRQKIEPKTLSSDHVYDNPHSSDLIYAKQTKWISSQFLSDTIKDLQHILSEDKSVLRESFLLADILDEALSLFDDLMTEKGLYLQVLGTLDVRLVMNRTLFGQFLSRALGYIFYEALPRSLITLSLRPRDSGMMFYFTCRVLSEERHEIEAPQFRSWSLNLNLLRRFATLSGCSLRVLSAHKRRLSFACIFSAQSLDRGFVENAGQVLPFSAALAKRRQSA